jgi:hypothetical protein
MGELLLLLLSLGTATLAQEPQCFVAGACVEVPFEYDVAASAQECLGLCQQNAACSWFTHYAADAVCTLLTACPSLDQECDPDCVSGEVSCEVEETQCDVPGRCHAIPSANSVVDHADACLTEACQPDPDCEWWTFDASTNICTTFADCPSLDECASCVSGEDDCQVFEAQCFVPGRCLEVPIHNEVDDDQYACLAACKNNADCEWFSFDSSTGICSFYEACSSRDSCLTCVSGENECEDGGVGPGPDPDTYPNVVVLGGVAEGTETPDVEVFSFDGTSDCSTPSALPQAVKGAAAGFANNVLMVCGGYDGAAALGQCYELTSNAWSSAQPLATARYFAAAAMTARGWWVSGGFAGGAALASTELLSAEGTWSAGPDLPVAMSGHCAVQIDARRVLLAGGGNSDNGFMTSSYIYDSTLDAFLESGALGVGRTQHGCALVGGQVIAAGGAGSSGPLAEAEAFDVASEQWTSVASLPMAFNAPGLVAADGKATLVGGFASPDGDSEAMWALEAASWVELATTLATPRYQAAVVTAPDQPFTGCVV